MHQYSEHAAKLLQEVESGKLKEEVQYWKTNLANHPPPLPLLPFSSTRSRSVLEKYDHNREDYRIDNLTQMKVRKMCQKQKVNPFHFYFAVFEVLLFKLLHTDDLCIGMADAGRLDEASSQSMGAYLNLLPLRFHLAPAQAFADVLKETRWKAYAAMANSRIAFDTILEEMKLERSTAYSPLFQAFFNYRQGVSEKRSFGSFHGEGGEYAFGRTSYDITLDIMENPGVVLLSCSWYKSRSIPAMTPQNLGRCTSILSNNSQNRLQLDSSRSPCFKRRRLMKLSY